MTLKDLIKKAARTDLTKGLFSRRVLSEREKILASHDGHFITVEKHNELRTTQDHSHPNITHRGYYPASEKICTYDSEGRLQEVNVKKFMGSGSQYFGAKVTFNPPRRLIGEREVYWK